MERPGMDEDTIEAESGDTNGIPERLQEDEDMESVNYRDLVSRSTVLFGLLFALLVMLLSLADRMAVLWRTMIE